MEKNEYKRLYRSRTNRTIGGIFGGLADYVNMDATILRVIWLLVVVFTGIVPGVIAYIVLLFVIPEEKIQTPEQKTRTFAESETTTNPETNTTETME